MYTGIVSKDGNYTIASIYQGNKVQSNYGGPWGDFTQFDHVEFDEVVIGSSQQFNLTAQDNGSGVTEIVLNIQPQRDSKLSSLRGLRNAKLQDADIAICLHNDSDPNAVSTIAAWNTYRISLRDITATYKDGSGNGTAALDAFLENMSDFNAWPVKPT